jgi:hypothetical protein
MPGPTQVLSRRALNRATLGRQMLLERERRTAEETIETLVGMQAQLPNAPYVALWSRLVGFHPDELSRLVEERTAVRITFLRGTIHLVTAQDCFRLRPVVQPALERDVYGNSTFGKHRLEGVDMAAVLEAGRRLVADRPLTNAQLRDELGRMWPDRDPAALAYAVRGLVPMVHVPPRGIWQRSGPIALTTVEAWLGRPVDDDQTPDSMVLRYLAAFGPSSFGDAQNWSGLTGLRAVFERLRPRLMTFRDERGRELFDLPDAPRRDPDTPAPVRFLPEYDNVLLGHEDRTRFVDDELRRRVAAEGLAVGSILVDGGAGGTWTTTTADGVLTMTIRLVKPLSGPAEAELADEAAALMRFLAPTASERRIAFGKPA